MAEKRAKDRVILKLIGCTGLLYSEEEADGAQERLWPRVRGVGKAGSQSEAVFFMRSSPLEVQVWEGQG